MIHSILYLFYGFLFLTLVGLCVYMFVNLVFGKSKLKVEITHIIFFGICTLSIMFKTEKILIPVVLFTLLMIIEYVNYKKKSPLQVN